MGIHLRDGFTVQAGSHLAVYFFVFTLFTAGVVSGALQVRFLDEGSRGDLFSYLQALLAAAGSDAVSLGGEVVFRQSVAQNFRTVGLLWFLGLTVIGVPLGLALVFLRGFVVGFSVGFLVLELGYKGLALSLLAVLPANLVAVPAVIAMGALSLGFSVFLVRAQFTGRPAGYHAVATYTVISLLLGILLVASSMVDAYVTPVFLRALSSYLL